MRVSAPSGSLVSTVKQVWEMLSENIVCHVIAMSAIYKIYNNLGKNELSMLSMVYIEHVGHGLQLSMVEPLSMFYYNAHWACVV